MKLLEGAEPPLALVPSYLTAGPGIGHEVMGPDAMVFVF